MRGSEWLKKKWIFRSESDYVTTWWPLCVGDIRRPRKIVVWFSPILDVHQPFEARKKISLRLEFRASVCLCCFLFSLLAGKQIRKRYSHFATFSCLFVSSTPKAKNEQKEEKSNYFSGLELLFVFPCVFICFRVPIESVTWKIQSNSFPNLD